jgi:ankyrin repeat protein
LEVDCTAQTQMKAQFIRNAAHIDQEEKGLKTLRLFIDENKQAFDATNDNDVPKMERIFKNSLIKQDVVDQLIFFVKSLKMMKVFLRHGGDIHTLVPMHSPYKSTLLWVYASELKNKECFEKVELIKMIKFLILEGADVHFCDMFEEMTAFWHCASDGQLGLLKLLIGKGADPKVLKNNTLSALHAASQNGHTEVCEYLVKECGLDMNKEAEFHGNPRAYTPLSLAAQNGREGVCKYLLKAGAKVDAGYQPLTIAAQV